MANYTFRTLEERQRIESMWEAGRTPKEISEELKKTLRAVYRELERGRDGSRLEDGRRRYSAVVANHAAIASLERRGGKKKVDSVIKGNC